MFIVFSVLLILTVFKALSYKSYSKVHPTEENTLKPNYYNVVDEDKKSISFEQKNYYQQLWEME